MSDAVSKKQPSEFYPPLLNPWLVRLIQWLSPLIARWFYKLSLSISPKSRASLEDFKDKRVLLISNHPTFDDPVVIFRLSARMRTFFYYLADAALFKKPLGPLLRRLGTYSILRGLPDRQSIKQTLSILTQPQCRLVVFPEGGCSFQNDVVSPFRTGAIQIAFQAMQKLAKGGQPIPDLYVVPLAIKYRYTGDTEKAVKRSLQRLESHLGITPGESIYQRLRTIGETVLQRCEREYGIAEPETPEIDRRIAHIKTNLLNTLEPMFSITGMERFPVRERVYRLQHTLNRLQVEEDAPTSWKDSTGQVWTLEFVNKSLWRVLNFDAIYDGYVAEYPSPERYLDTLSRLEREVLEQDQLPPKGHREAIVFIDRPLNLKDFYEAYKRDRSAAVEEVTQKLRYTIQQNLLEMSAETKTIS